MAQDIQHPHSIVTLLQNLRDDTTTLLRQEVQLAKAELSDKAAHLGKNVAQLSIGGFVAYAGVIVLLLGIADLVSYFLIQAGLERDLSQWLARAIVGIVIALIGWAMFAKAKKTIAAENVTPEKTVQTLKQDKQWAQNKLQQSHT